MLTSLNWLKKYLSLPVGVTAQQVAAKLILSTVEVEGVKDQARDLEKVVVGRVVKADKHPNADKLKVCLVDIGGEQLQIVCGGSNVLAGMKVAVAKIGAKVRWHGAGELVEMKPAKIREVESFGMICASTELGLENLYPLREEKEILDLSDLKDKPGTPLARALGLSDAVLEIDNKSLSNRPDLWGHYGLAREVSALFNRPLMDYRTIKIKPGRELKIKVQVEDAKLCPRYMAVAVGGVKVGESPAWLKKALLAVGLRPINNIVDITNYLMMDLGQPLHAFDLAKMKITGGQLTILARRAKPAEPLETLDGHKLQLSKEDLVIADEARALVLAGVMGGIESGISEKTTTIVLEAANFDAVNIRQTSSRHGLRTDSSARFEKSLDPNWCPVALAKAVELILEVCPGAKVVSNVADAAKFRLFTGPIKLNWTELNSLIGWELPMAKVTNILKRLGFGVAGNKGGVTVKIPTWRATKDISLKEDIVEEIIRVLGYDHVPASLPAFPITPPEPNRLRALDRALGGVLVKEWRGTEVYNYSFVSRDQVQKFGDDQTKYLELDNPVSKERPLLRRNLLTNLLESVNKNLADNDELRLWEVGKTFLPELTGARAKSTGVECLPRQDSWLTVVYTSKKLSEPFWGVRRAWELIAAELNQEFYLVRPDQPEVWQHPTRVGKIIIHGKEIGKIYELSPEAASRIGLGVAVGVLEVNLNHILEYAISKPQTFKAVPQFPEVLRDLAIVVDKNQSHGNVAALISGADSLVKKVEIFDIYQGEKISSEKKSLAYRITYGSADRTLKTEEIDAVQEKIIALLKDKLDAELRR